MFYAAQASARLMSCAVGQAEGSGFLLFRRGERIDFGFSEARLPGAGAVTHTGRRGGSATGIASVSRDEDALRIVQECSGNGLSQVDIDITLTTTPTISG